MKKILILALLQISTFYAFSQKYLSEIQAFEAKDSIDMPASGKILLVGSSTFRLWTTFKEDLKEFPVINRGFGGSQMSDLNFFFERIVTKYQPKVILVYEGGNDLNAGESPDSIFREFKEFVQKVKKRLPNTVVGFCSVRPSLARTHIIAKEKDLNQQVEKYCKKTKNVYFLDIQKDFYLPNGELMSDIFVADKLHLNAKGYGIWAEATRKFLRKEYR